MDATNARRNLIVSIILIVLLALLLTLPCLIYGYPFYGDDSASNLIMLKQFSQQFWSGELYPRWMQQMNGGLGDPPGFYYPPFAFWFSSLLYILNLGHSGWRELGLSASIAVIASGLITFFWLRKSLTTGAALIAALVYLVLPYHLKIDLYSRGALGELGSFVWMPLILACVDGVIARRRFAVVCVAISYALLILTHLPTTLIFSLVPVCYVCFVSESSSRLKSIVSTIAGMALGIGLAAIYLLPAMTMQQFNFLTTQGTSGHYHFGNWFLFAGLSWSSPKNEFFWAAIETMGLAVAAVAIARYGPRDQNRRKTLFWFAIALLTFFMMTPLSTLVWQVVPKLYNVQFPFRFNTVLVLSTAALVGFAFARGGERARMALGSTLVLLGALWIYETALRGYYAYPVHHFDKSVVEAINKRVELNRDTNEFRPRWVVSIEADELDDLLSHVGTTNGALNKVNVVEGQASVSVEKWTPREIVLLVDSPAGAVLNVSQFYFPGWAIKEDGGARAVQPSKPGGLIQVAAAAGRHRLTLQLLKRWPELTGHVVSLASLVVLLLLCIKTLFRGHKYDERRRERNLIDSRTPAGL